VTSPLHANIFWAEMLDRQKRAYSMLLKSSILKGTKLKIKKKKSLLREEGTLKAQLIEDLKRVGSCLHRLAAQVYYYFLHSGSFVLQNTTRIKNFVFDLRFV